MDSIVIRPLTEILSLMNCNILFCVWGFRSVSVKTARVPRQTNRRLLSADSERERGSFEYSELTLHSMNHFPKASHIGELKCHRCCCQPSMNIIFSSLMGSGYNSQNGILIFDWRERNGLKFSCLQWGAEYSKTAAVFYSLILNI